MTVDARWTVIGRKGGHVVFVDKGLPGLGSQVIVYDGFTNECHIYRYVKIDQTTRVAEADYERTVLSDQSQQESP